MFNFNRLVRLGLPVAALVFGAAGPSMAFEAGVNNQFNKSVRTGYGTSTTNVLSIEQQNGGAHMAAFKLNLESIPNGGSISTADTNSWMNFSKLTVGQFNEKTGFHFVDTNFGHRVSAFAE